MNLEDVKVDLAIWLLIFLREHGVSHWRELNKAIDDFIDEYEKEPQKFKKWIGEQIV